MVLCSGHMPSQSGQYLIYDGGGKVRHSWHVTTSLFGRILPAVIVGSHCRSHCWSRPSVRWVESDIDRTDPKVSRHTEVSRYIPIVAIQDFIRVVGDVLFLLGDIFSLLQLLLILTLYANNIIWLHN